MKKGVILLAPAFLVAITLISAFSFTDAVESIDPLAVIFLGLFTLIYFSLGASGLFKNKLTGQTNKAVTAVVSICVTLLAVYGINEYGFDTGDLFNSIGLSAEIISIIVLIGVILLLVLLKLHVLLLAGLFFLFLNVSGMAYEEDVALWLGIILLGIWGIIAYVRRKKRQGGWATGNIIPQATSAAWSGTKWGGRQLGRGAKWGTKKAAQGGGILSNKALGAAGIQSAQIKNQQRQLAKQRKKMQKELQLRYNTVLKDMVTIERLYRGTPPSKSPHSAQYDQLKTARDQMKRFARQNRYSL